MKGMLTVVNGSRNGSNLGIVSTTLSRVEISFFGLNENVRAPVDCLGSVEGNERVVCVIIGIQILHLPFPGFVDGFHEMIVVGSTAGGDVVPASPPLLKGSPQSEVSVP